MVSKHNLESVANLIKDYISMGESGRFREVTGISDGDFQQIVPWTGKDDGRILAVDGSNVVILDWAAARANQIRAGYVAYSKTRYLKSVITYDDIFLADIKNYKQAFSRYLNAIFGIDVFELDESELDRLSTYFRELQEYIALLIAVRDSHEGDLLLYDGGFAIWKDRPFGTVLEKVLEEARSRKVDLIGVSKSSSLSWGSGISRPFLLHAGLLGDLVLPGRPWFIDLSDADIDPNPSACRWNGRIYAVKFHKSASRAFRVDVPEYVVDHLADVLSFAATHSCSAESLGYPHPLFRAHHDMKIDHNEGRLVRLSLLDCMERHGLVEGQIKNSLDYHEMLDMLDMAFMR